MVSERQAAVTDRSTSSPLLLCNHHAVCLLSLCPELFGAFRCDCSRAERFAATARLCSENRLFAERASANGLLHYRTQAYGTASGQAAAPVCIKIRSLSALSVSVFLRQCLAFVCTEKNSVRPCQSRKPDSLLSGTNAAESYTRCISGTHSRRIGEKAAILGESVLEYRTGRRLLQRPPQLCSLCGSPATAVDYLAARTGRIAADSVLSALFGTADSQSYRILAAESPDGRWA